MLARIGLGAHKPGRRPISQSLFRLALIGRDYIIREADFDPGTTSISTKKMPSSTSYLPSYSGYLIVIKFAPGHVSKIKFSFSCKVLYLPTHGNQLEREHN